MQSSPFKIWATIESTVWRNWHAITCWDTRLLKVSTLPKQLICFSCVIIWPRVERLLLVTEVLTTWVFWGNCSKTEAHKHHRLTNTLHLTLTITTAQVVNNSLSEDYSHLDDRTSQTTDTPGFQPFATNNYNLFPL